MLRKKETDNVKSSHVVGNARQLYLQDLDVDAKTF